MISIAIITYNHEKYISQAIDSVLSQEINEEIEIVIGDDGSVDKTVDIIKKYLNRYSFIKLMSHENIGISKNIYDVFKNCSGEYIAVLEGDDYWLDKSKLKKQLKILHDGGYVATASNLLIVDGEGKPTGEYLHKNWKDRIFTKKEVEKYQTSLLMPSSLFFKNVFLDSGEKYAVIRDASKFGGSHSGMINLLGSIGNIYYMSDCLAVWRKVTSGGLNFSSRKKKGILDEYDQLHKYYVYKKEFGMDYGKQIRSNFSSCISVLTDELEEQVGKNKAFFFLCYSFFKTLLQLFRRKKK